MDFHSVESAFQQAVADGVFPGAVVLVSKDSSVVYEQAFGYRALAPHKAAMDLGTIFDLASLTKPIATTVAFMLLVKEKKLRLDDLVTRVIPMYGVFGKNLTTFRHLLNHSSGLPAWKAFFEEIIKNEKTGRVNFVASRAAKNFVYELVHREKPVSAPGEPVSLQRPWLYDSRRSGRGSYRATRSTGFVRKEFFGRWDFAPPALSI